MRKVTTAGQASGADWASGLVDGTAEGASWQWISGFTVTNVASLLMFFGMFGSIFLLAQFLQTVQHSPPCRQGCAPCPGPPCR